VRALVEAVVVAARVVMRRAAAKLRENPNFSSFDDEFVVCVVLQTN
jgi:hypothetical protein